MSHRESMFRFGAMALVLALTACSGLESGVMSSSGTSATHQAAAPKSAVDPQKLPDVREFGDVMIPREMEVDKDNSFIYTRGGAYAGLLRLYGRVDGRSLLRYFQNNMANDGWRMISRFQAPQSLLIFEKDNRLCLIAVDDSSFQTFADVWVVPRNETLDYSQPK